MEPIAFKAQPNRKAIPIGRTFILLFLIICLEIGGLFVYQMFIGKTRINPLLFIAVQRLIGMALVLSLIFRWGFGVDHIGLSADHLKQGIIHGILWCLSFGLIVGLIGAILFVIGVNPRSFFYSKKVWTLSGFIAYVLVGCLFGPMVEDLIFFGIFYNGLRARLNILLSVFIVASCFAIAHGDISISLIIQFVGALLFSLSFEFSGSLLAPMIIHWCGNVAILAIQIL